jgi:uncharacterized protein (TIGR02284 family)
MDNTKTIDLLNTLVVINQERMTGYETAENETESEELKALFSQCKYISQQNKSQLSKEVYQLGGIPDEDTKITGNFYRIWMDIKSALTGKDRQIILESCDYGEKVAADTYKEVLNNSVDEISNDQRTMLNSQLALLNANHYTIKGLIRIVEESKKD